MFLLLLILEVYLEHFGEILSEIVRCSSLDASATDRHIDLDCGCIVSACESLVLRLSAPNNRHSKELFVSRSVDFKDLVDEFVSLLLRGMGSVTLLPKKLSCPDERSGVLEFPPHDIGPLI